MLNNLVLKIIKFKNDSREPNARTCGLLIKREEDPACRKARLLPLQDRIGSKSHWKNKTNNAREQNKATKLDKIIIFDKSVRYRVRRRTFVSICKLPPLLL